MNKSSRLLLCAPVALVLAACASMGTPGGGPRDEDPPRFVRSSPPPGATGFTGDHVDLFFDELVNVKDAFTNVVVSPPSDQTPKVTTSGRRVTVRFPDSLKANTTYTIDFGSAIEDNNEANPLENFSYTFSTGETIDTLGISGMVLSAFDLEPQQGVFVGVHSNLNDSAFKKQRFDRVSRTDDRGRFNIAGLKPGTYRVFALQDNDADMKYSSPEEQIAFYDVTVTPTAESVVATDTIYDLKTGEIDTVTRRLRTVLLPNDLLLRSFTSEFKQQYLVKYERPDTTRMQFIFNSRFVTPPSFNIVGAPGLKDWAVEERSPGNDTITLWLRHPSLISSDTLHVAVDFEKTDSLMRLVPSTDTLRMTFDRRTFERINKKTLEDREKELRRKFKVKEQVDSAMKAMLDAQRLLSVSVSASGTQEITKPVWIETSTPLASVDEAGIRLQVKKDTVWADLAPPQLQMPDTMQPRKLRIDYPWEFGKNYRLQIDSLAMTGIYGGGNRAVEANFNTRAPEDYSSLTMAVNGIPEGLPVFVELLQGEKVLEREAVAGGKVTFPYLLPGKYYLRLYEDYNGNGKYDPGDYDKGLQSDIAYYYPKAVTLKKNWSKEESWDVGATRADLQKPNAIRKNRPKQRKGQNQKKEQEEEEEDEFGANTFLNNMGDVRGRRR